LVNSSYFKMLSKCFQKFANKTLWSFYYFSKKPLPNFIIFGLHLNHQILQNISVLIFPRNLPNPRGFSTNHHYLLHPRGKLLCVLRRADSLTTSCLPTKAETTPLKAPGRRLPSHLSRSRSPALSPASTRAWPPWPSPPAATRHLPDPLQACPEVHRAALFLPVCGIGPRWSESPPPSPFSHRTTELAAAEFATVYPPPAE
jgi:hypothetical protein